MARQPRQLPEGRMLRCPTKGCPNWLYAYLTPTGTLLAACMACKWWTGQGGLDPDEGAGEPAKEQG